MDVVEALLYVYVLLSRNAPLPPAAGGAAGAKEEAEKADAGE